MEKQNKYVLHYRSFSYQTGTTMALKGVGEKKTQSHMECNGSSEVVFKPKESAPYKRMTLKFKSYIYKAQNECHIDELGEKKRLIIRRTMQ